MLGDDARLAAHLDVAFRHRIGSLSMDVRFCTSAPWTVLFGASGSGKSTILRVIAGLEKPDYGKASAKGATVLNSDTRFWMPAHQRPIRWSGQRAYLTPRKKVKLQMMEGTATPIDPFWTGKGRFDELERLLDHFNLRKVENLLPENLSGGQRQMVSVIRAATGARGGILLLDEPFAGLDAKVRDELIANLRSWLGDTPIVSVTHDVGEAFLLGAEVVRIAEGRVVAQGPVGEVLMDERRKLLGVLT
jgi:molybdate transport system ATP-binding protein